MIDTNRMRLMKERANADVDKQCTTKYQQESKSTKEWRIPKNLIEQYMACPYSDRTDFLHTYGVEVSL